MKKLTCLFVIFSLVLLSSCGGKSGQKVTNTDSEELTTDSTNQKAGDDKISDCDDFLDKYEEWMDEYLLFLEDYKNNPADAVVGTRFVSLMQELGKWSSNWITLYQCSNEEKYQQRYEEISEKAGQKMKELGLE